MDFENMNEEQILQKLLDADTLPERTFTIPRLGIPVTLRGLTGKQVYNIKEQCTERKEKRGKVFEQIDEEQFNAAVINSATVTPNWGDPKLLAKYKASGPEEVIKRILLAGEISALGKITLDLSGFNTELADIKN